MRWGAALLSGLLVLSSGWALAADPVTYPDLDSCEAASPGACHRLEDGRWAPIDYNTGTGSEQPVEPRDEYLAMRQARAFSSNNSGTVDNPLVIVDMDLVQFPDAKPYLDHEINRVRVPIRFVAEAMGATVSWDQATQTVTITREGLEIKLIIDSSNAVVNGTELSLDAPAKLVQDRTMVPLRFISEAFGAVVEWVGTESPIAYDQAWGDYQVWIWIPWGYWGTATIYEREFVYHWWWHRDTEG